MGCEEHSRVALHDPTDDSLTTEIDEQRYGDRSDLVGGDMCEHKLEGLREPHRDPVAGFQSVFPQRVGQPVGELVEVAERPGRRVTVLADLEDGDFPSR